MGPSSSARVDLNGRNPNAHGGRSPVRPVVVGDQRQRHRDRLGRARAGLRVLVGPGVVREGNNCPLHLHPSVHLDGGIDGSTRTQSTLLPPGRSTDSMHITSGPRCTATHPRTASICGAGMTKRGTSGSSSVMVSPAANGLRTVTYPGSTGRDSSPSVRTAPVAQLGTRRLMLTASSFGSRTVTRMVPVDGRSVATATRSPRPSGSSVSISAFAY